WSGEGPPATAAPDRAAGGRLVPMCWARIGKPEARNVVPGVERRMRRAPIDRVMEQRAEVPPPGMERRATACHGSPGQGGEWAARPSEPGMDRRTGGPQRGSERGAAGATRGVDR